MTTDIEIARAAKPQNINKIAEKLGLYENDVETYGGLKAKVSFDSVSYTHLTLPTTPYV